MIPGQRNSNYESALHEFNQAQKQTRGSYGNPSVHSRVGQRQLVDIYIENKPHPEDRIQYSISQTVTPKNLNQPISFEIQPRRKMINIPGMGSMSEIGDIDKSKNQKVASYMEIRSNDEDLEQTDNNKNIPVIDENEAEMREIVEVTDRHYDSNGSYNNTLRDQGRLGSPFIKPSSQNYDNYFYRSSTQAPKAQRDGVKSIQFRGNSVNASSEFNFMNNRGKVQEIPERGSIRNKSSRAVSKQLVLDIAGLNDTFGYTYSNNVTPKYMGRNTIDNHKQDLFFVTPGSSQNYEINAKTFGGDARLSVIKNVNMVIDPDIVTGPNSPAQGSRRERTSLQPYRDNSSNPNLQNNENLLINKLQNPNYTSVTFNKGNDHASRRMPPKNSNTMVPIHKRNYMEALDKRRGRGSGNERELELVSQDPKSSFGINGNGDSRVSYTTQQAKIENFNSKEKVKRFNTTDDNSKTFRTQLKHLKKSKKVYGNQPKPEPNTHTRNSSIRKISGNGSSSSKPRAPSYFSQHMPAMSYNDTGKRGVVNVDRESLRQIRCNNRVTSQDVYRDFGDRFEFHRGSNQDFNEFDNECDH